MRRNSRAGVAAILMFVLIGSLMVLATVFAGCRPPPLVLSAPGDELARAQDRAWAEALTNRVNYLTHCIDVQTRECMAREARKQKEDKP